ncbi:dystonin isoform X1 [Melanerpes formicivorus]|uniref:dystonin isoform X1 n=2 Tax=Melanerpes formicivorus TaxID=211600 RepID=UPI00358E8841
MIAAAFLVLLRPYSIQCALFLLLLLLGAIATILFFCCCHRRLQKSRHPIKSVFSGRSRSRDAVMRTHHFRSEVIYLARNFKGFRSSPRHIRRRVAPRLEETQPLVEAHRLSEQETSVRKRKIKKSSRIQPEFYHSVQVTPTRKPSSGNASYRCSMSSSADFSDEDDFSQRSGTVSPAPGDTLPWNLPKHERSKRKIQGGSVLDPAERAVLRIADERDKVQKKTFTKWINQHLMKVRKHVNDLYEDLRDGHNLISLLEVLSGDTLPRERDFLKTLRLVSSTEACANEQHEDVEDEDKGPREKGRMCFHRLQNVQIALDYLKKRQVKLVNIRNDDITDGNPKLTLGLIWTIILHFQISDIHVTGESEDMSAKERLLLWSQQTTEGYAGIRCENFTTCWRDGRLFNAIIHKYRPDLIDMNSVAIQSNHANLEHAFFVAEKLGVARLLDPEDVDVSSPDEKSVITYVSSLYDAFPKVPEGGESISANDVEVKWVEYQNMVNYLVQWIRHHVTIMSDRTFPNNPVELKAFYNQYLQFKEREIPPKETDKSKIKHLYKLLEVWIEFGRIKLPQGYHPNDIEKEWGKLIIAMLEREKTLRHEVERLEILQQIANGIQRNSQSCESKLILAWNALQSDAKRLESGLQYQHEAEVAGFLLESENLLHQQVVDAQILIDGKYYQADQLVQRFAKLRDELVAIRTECAAVYNKGHALTTEQTKLMISGMTESLNSGFTTNLTPELNATMTQALTPTLASSSLTSDLSSGLTSRLTPTVTPAYMPGVPPRLIQSYVTGVDSGSLQTLKLMQIRKPPTKSAFVDQNFTEEEVNMKFVQDLLNWVEEMQVQLDRAEWGSDLPSVESHLENHKHVHKAIEEFESSLKEAKISEIQMTAPLKLSYAEKLHKLESQYSKLLNTSRNQERHLDTLHDFVCHAVRELIWLNEKEEEEVAYDWSERNPNITRKKEYHAELMRELDQKEEVIKSVQEIAEQLLLENHPARLTIEAYRAAMQTQWSWILQLCHCVEQHLRENAAYFEFFTDAKEAMEYLKNLKDTIYQKYSCDRSSSLHRLEDLVQESMEEKEQLLQYKSTVAGLVGRAKAIIQLKPRNPDCIHKTSIPIKAICDYRQIEITIYKDDECVLANNSHRAKWKVISPSGNEAMVPSVCFTVPPPNKEAIDTANRIEQQFQNVLALWHESHVSMKSVVSWHYLTIEIEAVRSGNVASIKTMLPGEHQQVLSNLQSCFDDFVQDSQESKIFTSSDKAQLEREVNVCKQYYQELLKSAEREEQEESIYNLYISEVRTIRLQLESCEERLIRQIRTPMERDDLHESVFRISEQEKLKKELDRLKDDLGVVTNKCEEFFSQAAGSPSVPTLRSELSVVTQKMNQVYSLSSIYIDKLKSVNLVLKNTQGAESLVKLYETKLCEEEAVTADKNNIENLMGTLKQWRSEVDENRQVFHALEDELQKAKMISDQMFKTHKERDLDFDWHKEKVDQLAERWQNILSQMENRLHDLEGINKSLKYYKDTYNSLDIWIQQVEDTQRKIQEIHPENIKELAKQLNQHKMLVSEIERKQSKIDECQKYSEQYSAAVKDYELHTMTYRAMVDSQQKSLVKRRRMRSSSDFIIQEFMDLRTRYTALVTLMTQYIKFAGDSLKRLEEEESLPEESEVQQPEKSADVFQCLEWNEAGEFREKNTPNESMMNVEYLQEDNSSSKHKHTENKLEIDIRKLDVDRHKKSKTKNANTAFSEIMSIKENSFPVSEHGLAKNPSSQDEKASEKKISQNKIYGLDNINTSRQKQNGKGSLDEGQKCKDLVLIAEMDSRGKGCSTKVPGKKPELQKLFCENMRKKASFAKKENQRKRINGNEEKRSTTVKKSMEEEKKEHVEKAGHLLKWMSNLSKTLSKQGEKTEKTDLPKQQISLDEMSTKKEQIAEALQTTQSFLAKHSDKMTDEERNEMEKQVKSLQESYNLLSNEALKQLQKAQYLGDEKTEEKDVAEQQQECKEKLQEICDLLTQTENQLIGQQESLVIGDSKAELQQYQTKQEEIQKDMRMSAQTLAEIVKNTEAFLKESGEKLSQEDKAVIEQKLNEAKTKCLLLIQKAEESKKELDKAMTTAIKQETEKVAAIEQLEESKNTINNLLDWLSNVDKEAEHGWKYKQVIEQNGTHFEEGDVKALEGEEDDVNGNLLEIEENFETQVDGLVKSTEDNLNQQYQKVKAQHDKIISQQQAVIVATQSAQALLEKQGHYLSPEEKEKMQRNMKELKAQYETVLAESERKIKLTHSLRGELQKFDADYGGFETWLQQAEQELDNLEAGASDFGGIMVKLKRQRSFSEDVISHKGDLRYITISGQRVLDASRSCSKRDGAKVDKDGIDTSATYTEVQNKLDNASDRFKSLYTKYSILGNNLKDLVDKYQHYEDASSGLLSGLQASEIAVNKQLSEPIAVDPKNLQRQLEENKVLQGQVSNHQIAVEKLKKAAEVLLESRRELTPNKDEIQKTLDDVVERYDNLSKSVNERNEKLQITLTRSLSVQDGLDEMLYWMEGVEKSLEEQNQVPLNSAAIQDIISKSIMLEQDMAGRQSSINTMNEKMKKFTETADPSTASTLQAKINELAGRFSEASNKHKEKLMKMEELKTKVELLEGLSEKLQSFIDEKNQALSETEAPRKDVSEVSQYMQEASVELAQHKKDLEVLQQLLEELSSYALPGDKALVLEKVNSLSKKFREVEETVKEKEEDVLSCQKQMDTFEVLVESLKKWIKETTERIPAVQLSLNTEDLKKLLEDTLNLKDEWTSKAPELQKMNRGGTLLCNIIAAVTSPAKMRAVAKSGSTMLNGEGGAPGTQDFLKNKELTIVQQAMSDVNHSYEDLGVLLKEKISELESMLSKMQNIQEESTSVMQWLQKMDKTASDWEAAPTDGEAVKAQVEQHKVFETELKQSANKVQELKDKVTELLEKNPDSPEAPKWRQTLDKLDSKWKELNQVTSERQQKLEESSNYLTQFQTAEAQLKHWLVEKELMVSVLGPLSIDPNMLNTQKQQVQVFETELKQSANKVQELKDKVTELLEKNPDSPEAPKWRQTLDKLDSKWKELNQVTSERQQKLEESSNYLTQFQTAEAQLKHWLVEKELMVSVLGPLSIDPNMLNTQKQQVQVFETELKQSANKVQELKDKVTELLEKNPDSPEAPKWRQTLDKLDSKWKELNQVTSERQQKLEESSNYLTQFQTAEAQLKHWLVEKELMVSVLGPLSIDPNMLNTQKQQVQILLKEFDTRKPQYEQLTMAGEGILKRPGEHPPSHKIVKEQLAAVAQKWDSLTGQLWNRCDRIDQAFLKSTEYQSLLRTLSDKLSALDSKLSSSLAVSTQPDAMKQQLEIAREMKEEIEQEMKNIKAAQALCEELSTLVREEYLKAELTRQLDGILKLFKDIDQKADSHVQQLQSAYATSHQFHQMSKDFQAWLGKKNEELNQARPISAKLDTLQSLIEEQKDFKETMTEQISPYERIVAEGESILQKTQGADKAALQSQLATLRSNWDEMNKQVKERQDKLTDCLEKALKYKQHVENLKPWIEKCQNNLCELKVGINPVEIENSIVQVRAWQKDLDKHHGMVELLNSTAESLLSASQTDKETVQEETTLLNQKVNVVTEQLHKKKECLENMAQRLKEFQESSRETEKQLKIAKEYLEAHDSLGPQSFSNKHLVMMQAQHKALQALKPHVDLAKKLAQDLVIEVSDSAGVSDLLLQAESLEQEYSAVNQKVEDRCSFLETKLQGIGHFQNSIREMFSQFAEFDDELDSMAAVGRDLTVLQSQREDIKRLLKKLEDLIMNNENANKNCKMMLATEAEASPDLAGIKRDLEALNKQCSKLLDRAKAREDQVEDTISHVEEFYSKLKEFSSLLGRAEEHEESQGPVGMETETINQQLDTFKVFQKEEIEPLQVKQQEVNWLGQGLIQSAAKSTNTENLEHDLEDVNTRWKTLNKKVAQRAAQLQEALLHCGRFQDALESLLSWLIDTEDLVANQKQPSAEFKVVKAQIQEQKLLQRLLDDHKPTVEVIKHEGEKIAESAEPADKVKILKQLSFLDSRWDALLSKAEIRNRQLEGILVVAQQFHEALEPLVEWLNATEKRLANAEPIGTQASKLQQQISQHKALEDDVLAHNKSLHQAISTGQSLKTMSSREDKDMVQEKLDSAQACYIEIQEKSNSRSELLQQAYSNAQIFGEDEVELMNWLNEVHDKLSKLSVQDCNTELLENQHSELLDLQEEILLRKQNVDLAIQNGLDLLKQTTGDEVVTIQDKLEGIKARYRDITKLSSDVSKTLEQALQLAGQLHSTHEELCKWLDEVEVELLLYETQLPMGEKLSQIQERQKELKKEAKNNKGLLDTLNEVGSAFLELVPWRAREGLDKMITEVNERYRLVSDMISQKVDEIDAALLRSQQFDQAANAEFAWIAETEKKLMSLGDIRLEQYQTTAQLQVQKAFTMEILRHKDTIDELVKSGEKIMNVCTEEEKQSIKKKMKSLLQKYDAVCQMNSERNLQLERAQSLVNQFWETYEELWPWLTETETIISQLPAPALEYETLKQQQEEHRQLRELIAEHKPHIDKMNKTGPQLLELSPGEGFSIQKKYVAADTLYSKIKEDVKKRALALDEAISQCTQFHDKIDPTLESLKRIAERLRQPPLISAEVEKIKEQISENKNMSVDLEKLQPVYETLKQRGEEMIARSEGADKDISAKAVQDKLDQMVLIWEDIQTLTEEREAKLLDVMELAEKFWCDHMALVATIKDTQDFIRELEGPGVDPSVVKQQQEATEAAKEEIDGLQEELEAAVSLGSELRAACGEPDKPIVNKSIDELNSAWDALNKTWKERVDKLAEAMQAAVQYQDGLQAVFDWVDIAGSKLASMSPVGTDLETVKQQTEELKQFKTEAYQQQIEMERLNHQAELLLKQVTQESDKHTVQDPLSELKLMWDTLEEKIISRQHKLEGALLALGQFQHALDELLTWLTHTEDLLNEQKPVGGDPKAVEIELAKHHVLQNDVLAHQSTVEAVKKAGNDLIESSAVEEASNLRSKLELLNQRWQNVLEKTEQRKEQLQSALIQTQGFHGEVEDLQQWLTDTERQLLASKPVGGLPETAREQLNTHMERCAAFEAKEETYRRLMQKGQQMLARCPESSETNIEQDINNLKEKWESVQTKLSERKTKLEEALNLAMEFHNSLQDFINWLIQAEQTLTAASRPSLILDTVLFQIDEHKVFATEVNSHRDQIIELDKTGTHLKYFSQKQDVVLIKNLLISVQSRWEKVVQRLLERGRALDDARKRAKQFHEAWHKLMEWLEESEKSLDSDLEIANDPDKIKMQLAQHKEFQKFLGAKHSVYDTTNRTGRSLKEKTTLADDNLKLDDMLSELMDKWDTICGKSVERQNKLEEALLFSGQFTDALQALIDWLYKIEPQLAEDQPVHGDIDLVINLIDNHKVFQKELGKRTSSVQALKRSARELIEGSRDDSSWVKVQMQELSTRWETVCALSISKRTRLEQALRQAEEFHSVVHVLLEWLAEAEQTLRFHGVLPDDEEALRTLIDQHREFMKKVEEKKAELNKATGMGEAILAICHPDSITTIKHWITIIRARFEEVLAWAKQHQQRLAGALAGLIANQELLEALLSWLQWAETTLTEKDKGVIPQEVEEVKTLIAEHQTFMEEITRKQPDVDKVTKTYKRKALEPTPVQSHIPVLDKGRAGRKRSPTPGIYPSAAQAQIKTKNPRVNLLVSKWQQVWLLALERRRKLNDALDRLEELREFANFDFDVWRKKYMRWMNHKKSRVMDFFRRIDKDQDGKITRQEFIDGILSSKFPTSRLEMSAVADIFDRDGDGYIDYYEFVAALHPNKDAYKPLTDADKIEDEVTRQVAKCKCAKRFQVEQIGDNKYKFFLGNQFGDSQQLRLVRILRSTVMVRVGGGWMALDEFLVKNDPCRVHHHGSKMLRSESNSSITTQPTIAKGRTNVELREKFILADGASQSMAAFRPRGRRSRPSSRGASPNRSTSLSSQAGQAAVPQAVATSTLKTPHHLTRNSGKPWLTNSKTSTPSKLPESSDYQGSSAEGTPIQGSKLRLPGYLSGKGFHSGEDSGILSTAATRVRAQFAETKRIPSRPGSKAGSRSSSRRGSDASDFDISEIQSMCSDMSETVPATSRPTLRAGSRPGSAKPSKIPTPQRRPLATKLDKSLKR